jgi:cell division protein FtsB
MALSNKDNLAYDFDRFDTAPEEIKKPKIKVNTIKPEKIGNIFMMVVLGACALVIMVIAVKAQSDLAALQTDISAAKAQVDVLASENVRMETEIESRSAIKYVEDYAENVLGMRKLDKSQVEYIDVQNGNQIYIPDTEAGFFTKIKNAVADFVEYLKG